MDQPIRPRTEKDGVVVDVNVGSGFSNATAASTQQLQGSAPLPQVVVVSREEQVSQVDALYAQLDGNKTKGRTFVGTADGSAPEPGQMG